MSAPQVRPQIQHSSTPNNAQIFIGRLNPDTTENDLYTTLSTYGPISYIRLLKPRDPVLIRKFAFVAFQDIESAHAVRRELNGELILGKHATVSLITKDRKIEANIFVKNFPPDVKAKDLEAHFSQFGNIISSVVIYDQNENSLRYGFIQFEKPESASRAIEQMNGRNFGGETLNVSKFLPISQRPDGISTNNLYVRGFDTNMTEQDLQERFEKFGKVTSVSVIKQKKENVDEERAFGFVCFENDELANTALENLNGKTEGNITWYIVHHMKKRTRIRKLKEDYQRKVELWKKTNVFVRGLPNTIDNNKLRQICEDFGRIASMKIMTTKNIKYEIEGDSQIQKIEEIPTGTAFVCYETPQEANAALRGLSNIQVEGNKLICKMWKPREERIKNMKAFKQKQMIQFKQNSMMMGMRGAPSQMRGRAPMPSMMPSGPAMLPSRAPPQIKPTPPRAAPMQPPMRAPAPPQPTNENQRQALGERLYPQVLSMTNQNVAGKITGMLLEMNLDLVSKLVQDPNELRGKVNEAVEVLRTAWSNDPEKLKSLP